MYTLKFRWTVTRGSQNANSGEWRKSFVRANLWCNKKSIRSIHRTFHRLQNCPFSLFIWDDKVDAKSLIWKAMLWKWANLENFSVDRIQFHRYSLAELFSLGSIENCIMLRGPFLLEHPLLQVTIIIRLLSKSILSAIVVLVFDQWILFNQLLSLTSVEYIII
jgi:hypothetical protein